MNKIEIRYSTEFYSNALYGEYSSMDESREALTKAVQTAMANGDARVAKTFHIC